MITETDLAEWEKLCHPSSHINNIHDAAQRIIPRLIAEVRAMRKTEDITEAAIRWQEIHAEKGRDHHDTKLASGYLYDRVRNYKIRISPPAQQGEGE